VQLQHLADERRAGQRRFERLGIDIDDARVPVDRIESRLVGDDHGQFERNRQR
jgi:hypothetical protein